MFQVVWASGKYSKFKMKVLRVWDSGDSSLFFGRFFLLGNASLLTLYNWNVWWLCCFGRFKSLCQLSPHEAKIRAWNCNERIRIKIKCLVFKLKVENGEKICIPLYFSMFPTKSLFISLSVSLMWLLKNLECKECCFMD